MAADFVDSTLISGVIGAVVGGAVAAIITARVNLRLARDVRRDRASVALWEYHRALTGFAAKLYDSAGHGDEIAPLAHADMTEVREAFNAAYPWAGYLRKESQAKLFHGAYFVVGFHQEFGDTTAADSVSKHANELRVELTRKFPLK